MAGAVEAMAVFCAGWLSVRLGMKGAWLKESEDQRDICKRALLFLFDFRISLEITNAVEKF